MKQKRGYSDQVRQSVQKNSANPLDDNCGVELGRLCILHGYSVVEVAEVFKVSRTTVYNWFHALSRPTKHLEPKVLALVTRLQEKPIPQKYIHEDE